MVPRRCNQCEACRNVAEAVRILGPSLRDEHRDAAVSQQYNEALRDNMCENWTYTERELYMLGFRNLLHPIA